ncbi:unnamed protein product [Phytomonas sp. EM1]|nr:unnamed protein product [Phytomonas sp. EM1]|eukprot:CCW63069.1 unnamed protein product [Phytomonas sp. isolate EM1]
MFDRTTDYQSPLARHILSSLPMVEEVTIGSSFVTVKRVEQSNAKAAARYFAMQFNGTMAGSASDDDNSYTEAVARRSQELQNVVQEAMREDEGGVPGEQMSTQGVSLDEKNAAVDTKAPEAAENSSQGDSEREVASVANPMPPEPGEAAASPDDSFELGGFKISSAPTEDIQLDEQAIQSLIEASSWSELKLHVSALITDHLYSGQPHVSPDAPHPYIDTLPQEGDSEVVLMIKELIDTNIRPQLQKDGGDIRFIRFNPETGLMVVELLGACRTCKSGPTTLVDLIERTTFHWIPEVKGVLEIGKKPSGFEKFADAVEEGNENAQDAGVPIELDQVKVPVLRRRTSSKTTEVSHVDKASEFASTNAEESKVAV